MKIDSDMIRSLNLEHIRRSKEAARKLMEDGDLDGAKADLEWAETASQLIAFAEKGNRLRLSALIAFICLLIAGLSWSLHVCSTQVYLEVVTENVSLTLFENWSLKHQFTPDSIHINNVEQISAPGLILPDTGDLQGELTTISLKGKKMSVNALSLPSGAEIELNSADGKLNLFVKKSPLVGELLVERAELLIETENKSTPMAVNAEPPETISFTTAETNADPVWFELGLVSNSKWLMYGFNARKIGFLEEGTPGSGHFGSVIISGNVKLPDTGKTENLRKSDRLILKGVQSRRIEFSNAKHKIHVVFEGTVSEILIGPQGFEKNLTPTYLEYIYHQQRLGFFWGVVVFLWGMLWSIRHMIFSESFVVKGFR